MPSAETFGGGEHEPPIPLEFRKADGRTHKLSILSSEKIGKGGFGFVYRIDASLSGENGRSRNGTYVLKEFQAAAMQDASSITPEVANADARTFAARALAMHTQLKEANLPTWTTYRLSESGTAILMTDGELTENEYIVGYGHTSAKSARHIAGSVKAIANLEDAISKGIDVATRASAKGFRLIDDVWFTRFQRTGEGVKADFFIGDLDSIRVLPVEQEAAAQELLNENLSAFANSAAYMIEVGLGFGKAADVIRERLQQRIRDTKTAAAFSAKLRN